MKNDRISLYYCFDKIKGPATSFQSAALSQNHVRNIWHRAHYYLTKFHFGSTKDSEEVSLIVTSIMQQ